MDIFSANGPSISTQFYLDLVAPTISLNACPDVPRPGKAGKPWSPTKRRAQTIGKTIGKW